MILTVSFPVGRETVSHSPGRECQLLSNRNFTFFQELLVCMQRLFSSRRRRSVCTYNILLYSPSSSQEHASPPPTTTTTPTRSCMRRSRSGFSLFFCLRCTYTARETASCSTFDTVHAYSVVQRMQHWAQHVFATCSAANNLQCVYFFHGNSRAAAHI